MSYIDVSTLKFLNIKGVSKPKHGLSPSFQARIASFTMLQISDYEEDAAAAGQLIRWPKRLEIFTFGSFYNHLFYMDLAMFRAWLLIHKDSPREIDIGYLSTSGTGILLDVSDFPNLRTLTLSRYSFLRDLHFSAADSYLLAPKLESFTCSFSIYDQHDESWTDFGEPEERWMMQFAKAAVSKSLLRKRIEVIFQPGYWCTREEDGYP
ncbi:putative F-box domain protein [Seiridium cardinale]|uniref:F-box domain protein n=1 Tax=Seiridium cardinale TaxID=138064 RepID=A0ABR2XQ37_9PEZI